MKEFIINKYIKLRLEYRKTNLYVNGKLFNQCKYLLVNIPEDKNEFFFNIKSIDDAEDLLGSLEEGSISSFKITPEQEFWAHSSNLQAWAENNYDTRFLHRTIAFPLLKRLYNCGDPIAKSVFKEEIIRRYEEGSLSVKRLLLDERYIQRYVKQEFLEYFLDNNSIDTLDQISRSIKRNYNIEFDIDFFSLPSYSRFSLVINRIGLIGLDLRANYLDSLPASLFQMRILKKLFLGINNLNFLSGDIINLKSLEQLDLSDNSFNSIPQSIKALRSLKYLNLSQNEILEVPEDLIYLDSLEHLDLGFNKISHIPDSISKLKALKFVSFAKNNISTIPESISKLKHLKVLDLHYNNLDTLPPSLSHIKSLEKIYIDRQDKEKFSESIRHLLLYS